jgi:putative ABC transport system permease protein
MRQAGITRYRAPNFRYDYSRDLASQWEALKPGLAALAELNEKYGTTAMFHTHSSQGSVGGGLWDLWLLVKDFAPSVLAINYDLGHAVVRGGTEWMQTARFAHRHVQALSVKDVRWVKREDVPNDGSGIRTVTEGLFDTLQIPVLAGRGFTAADRLGAPSVAVVSDAFARQFLTDLDPVGQRLRFPQADEDTTIVGVVGATRHLGLDEEPRAEIYLPFAQDADRATLLLAIRTSGDPALLAEALRRTVADLDRGLPVEEVKTMGALIAGRVAERRFYMTLLALFAGLAAVLAATGIYGVMSCLVGQSRREIGIRLALGARPIQVRAGVVRQGLTVVAVGAALGLVGARWLSDLLATQLFEVPTTDWATYALATAGLAILATLACWMPTRMASIISPVEALRD